MNATMVRRFCTLQEAAERLNATEDQIENLLRKGILHEFRDGSHRLLRTADVGAILMARTRRLERRGRPLRDDEDNGDHLPRLPDSVARASRRVAPGPETTRRSRQPGDPDSRTSKRRLAQSAGSRSRSSNPRTSRRRREPEALPPRPSLSVREWLWIGLTQDHPVAIALLSGLVLLILAGLVAGACLLADLR